MPKKTKKATVRRRLKYLRKGETIQQHNTRLLEEMNAALDILIEKMAKPAAIAHPQQ